jgi:hypothetical protein
LDLGFVGKHPAGGGKGFQGRGGRAKIPSPQPPSFLPALIRHGLEISILEFEFRKILKNFLERRF